MRWVFLTRQSTGRCDSSLLLDTIHFEHIRNLQQTFDRFDGLRLSYDLTRRSPSFPSNEALFRNDSFGIGKKVGMKIYETKSRVKDIVLLQFCIYNL